MQAEHELHLGAAVYETVRERLLTHVRRACDAFVTGLMDQDIYCAQVGRIKAQLAKRELRRPTSGCADTFMSYAKKLE